LIRPDAGGDGANAAFRYNNAPVDLFEYARGSLSGGTYKDATLKDRFAQFDNDVMKLIFCAERVITVPTRTHLEKPASDGLPRKSAILHGIRDSCVRSTT
jgi:hypothetical protein